MSLPASVVYALPFLGQGKPSLKTMLHKEKWHRWSKSHEKTRGGLLPYSQGKLGLMNEMPKFRHIIDLAAGSGCFGVTWTLRGLCSRTGLSFQTYQNCLIPQGATSFWHKQTSSAEEEQSWECAVAIAEAGESMETPERVLLYVVAKQHNQRQYQGTYKACCEARIISIHLAKCFQSSLESR